MSKISTIPTLFQSPYLNPEGAPIIGLAAANMGTGRTYILKKCVNNRIFQSELQRHNLRGLVIHASPLTSYDGTLVDMHLEEKLERAEYGIWFLNHIYELGNDFKGLQEKAIKPISTNLDLLTIARIGKRPEVLEDTAIKHLPAFIEAAKYHYDFILVKLPHYSKYFTEFRLILEQTSHLLLTYPMCHLHAMGNIFNVNHWYSLFRAHGLPIKFGIIPLLAGTKINLHGDQIVRLQRIFDRRNVLPAILDENETIAMVNKRIREITEIGINPLVTCLLDLILGEPPRGLNQDSIPTAQRLLELFDPFTGLKRENFVNALDILDNDELTVEQKVARELDPSGNGNRGYIRNLFSNVMMARHYTFEECLARMETPLGHRIKKSMWPYDDHYFDCLAYDFS